MTTTNTAKAPLLPVCTMTVRCTECEAIIGEYDSNLLSLLSVLAHDRRAHAVEAHGYPRRPGERP